MSEAVRPEGWHNWGRPQREKTARYSEYKSSGPGAAPEARVAWSRQLSDAEAAAITVDRVLGGQDNWTPKTALERLDAVKWTHQAD
jgi:pectinesterase